MNNREFATFIILVVLATFVILNPSTRTVLPTLAKQLFTSRVMLLLVPFVAVLLVAIWFADYLSLWSHDLLGATVLWFLLVGFVWFINLDGAGKDPDFFKRRFLETLGFAAFLEFFINAQVMPLPAELVAQLFLLVVVMLNVAASEEGQYKPVATLTSVILAMASLALLTYSVLKVVADWDTLDKHELASELLMPIWLTATAIPILYLLACYMGYELLFIRLSFLNESRKPSLRARLGIALGLRGALVDVAQFRGMLARDAARSQSVSEARTAVKHFKRERAAELAARAAARESLIDNAGREGVDENGLALDRREFAETKEALTWLATCHMGWYRNKDRPDDYRTDLLDVLSGSHQFEFPTPEPVSMHVRKDHQAWYAYRRTPSGHVFGIGASGPPPSQWFYDGPTPPSGFPSKASKGWAGFMSADRPEWGLEPKT